MSPFCDLQCMTIICGETHCNGFPVTEFWIDTNLCTYVRVLFVHRIVANTTLMRYRFPSSALISARHQLTLLDHRYGLVHHVVCLFTPQLSLALNVPTRYLRKDGQAEYTSVGGSAIHE